MYRKIAILCLTVSIILSACQSGSQIENKKLAQQILADKKLDDVYHRAKELVRSGFNAGTKYNEVWIRDYNTFIEVSCDVLPIQQVRDNLLVFFNFQGDDGNIIDGFIPIEKVGNIPYDYIYTDKAPEYAGHKNTVETDQESSLVQAVSKYINRTGDTLILQKDIFGKTVLERLQFAMEFLLNERYSEKYGLLWGATTADWGDVQPEHEWGVVLDNNSHLAIDIYDNAMFVIALNDLIELINDKQEKEKWITIRDDIKSCVRKYLWNEQKQKFIPHIYLNGSPFPDDFDENKLHYHGGTAVAIEAGLLSKKEIEIVNSQMVRNVNESGALSIGLTIFPPYPEGYFKNPSMSPFGYQNGGDWTWFGARMIQQLVENGFVEEAYNEIQPMINRVIENNGFMEWYTVDGQPTGAGDFRGSAGVLAEAIELLKDWADNYVGPELLVMSFNIRNGRADDGENRWEKRRDILYDIFRNHKPDIVGLQEAVSFQIDEICKALPEYKVVTGSKEGKTNGQYVAILFLKERFDVEEYATFWFSRTPDLAGSKHPDNNWARTCTWAKLTDKKSGHGFFVYNLHLGGSALEENIQLLGRRLRDRKPSYPVIVLGDFNADESNPAILYLKDNILLKPEDHDCADTNPVPLIDSFRVLHPDVKAGTYNGFKGTNNGNKIDYVFVQPGTEVIEAQILHDNRDGRYPSDHFPVTARIRLHSNEH